MAVILRDYLLEEHEQSGGITNIAISPREGSCEATYILFSDSEQTPLAAVAVSNTFDYFCGSVANIKARLVNVGVADAGKVVRVLPPVHPLRPDLSCSGVLSCTGMSKYAAADAIRPAGLEPVSDRFPNWIAYKFRVKFAREPYYLLDNNYIALGNSYYYPPDGSSGSSVFYAEEWKRFTSTTRVPTGETLSASNGQMSFRTQSGTFPNESGYTGQPFMSLKNEMVEITWYQVPYRYMLDFTFNGQVYGSYLTRFTNTVNRWTWNGYAPGSLLYLGATPTIYKPITPTQATLLEFLTVGQDQSMLCDIKLRFLYTARTGTDVPNSGHALLTNKNFVAAGHNLLPHFGNRKFYYSVGATSGTGVLDASRRPLFESFPFELLFTDPLLQQPGGPI